MKKVNHFENSHKFSKAINNLIPGGAHTYSKGDDQFPYNAPKGIVKGKGSKVWDVDDNEYIDWAMGLGSVSLGHAFEPIIDKVIEQLYKGANYQRPGVVELEFAELLADTLPQFDMFKFAKNGSTVTTAAVKLARAYTGRDMIAVCADQPFFSYDDWFIGSTVCSAGIPKTVQELTQKFNYNDINSVKELFKKYAGKIAAVILEPAKLEPPKDKFLHQLKELCTENGVVFILDEMITGFRYGLNGAQGLLGIEADLATYGKGIANGFSVAVLAGKREIMELGGSIEGKERVFLASTTHGSENHALTAAIASIKFMRDNSVFELNKKKGEYLIEETQKIISKHNLEGFIEVLGYPYLLGVFFKDYNKEISPAYRTLFMQEMIGHGILFTGIFTIAHCHDQNDMDITLRAFDESCEVYAKAIEEKDYKKYLVGDVVKPVFRKFN